MKYALFLAAAVISTCSMAACRQGGSSTSGENDSEQNFGDGPIQIATKEDSQTSAPPATKASPLPGHTVERSALSLKEGQRVQINVSSDITQEECSRLIDHYRSEGAPDGQVSVRKPSPVAGGQLFPWCIENFDGRGVTFNEGMF